MNMTLEPGTDVSVQKLSERYGVSRTPVREAVVRLQQSDLVEIYPQRKTVVSKINIDRIHEEWFIRTTLESGVVDEFIRNCSELVADTLQELIHKQKRYLNKEHFMEFYSKDNRFHQLIFETAKETLSWKTIENTATHYNRVRLMHGKMEGIGLEIINEHERIVEAARKRDVEAMRKAVKEHSYHLLDQLRLMMKQYPQFFQGNLTEWINNYI